MSQNLFDGTPGSQVEQGPVRQTEGSPVRPTSEAISDAYRDLSGTPFSSTPANQQRVRGARPFSSPSPVPSASRSYKRTRLDDSSPSNASMRLHMDASADSLNPYDIPDDVAQWPAGDFSGSQVRRGDLQDYLQPAVKARVDQYVQQCVADAVERAVATIEGKVEALKARVDQLETALREKEPGTPRRQKVDKQVSVSTYFRYCNYIKLVSGKLSRKKFICCKVSPFLVENICDTTEQKN